MVGVWLFVVWLFGMSERVLLATAFPVSMMLILLPRVCWMAGLRNG